MLQFTIPFLPPSINCSQTMSRRVRDGKAVVRVETSAAARTFKSQAKFYMPKAELGEDKVYEVRIRICGNWLTQRLVPRDKDLRNHAELVLEATLERYAIGRMGKLITDAIFANYKTGDKLVWVDRLEKVQSVDERVEVEIMEYEPSSKIDPLKLAIATQEAALYPERMEEIRKKLLADPSTYTVLPTAKD